GNASHRHMLRSGYSIPSFCIAERRRVCHEQSPSSRSRLAAAAAPPPGRHASASPGPQSSRTRHPISVDLPKTESITGDPSSHCHDNEHAGSSRGGNSSSEGGRRNRNSVVNGARSNSLSGRNKRARSIGVSGGGGVIVVEEEEEEVAKSGAGGSGSVEEDGILRATG
ncbi:hypothetical protein Vretimale_12864, partial [Volvox reticuliferus]